MLSTQDLGDRIVTVHNIPFMRQRRIFAKAQGLRPKTRYWPFFDGINVSQWCLKITGGTTGNEYENAIQQRRHLIISDPDVNVGLLQHPDVGPGSTQETDHRRDW